MKDTTVLKKWFLIHGLIIAIYIAISPWIFSSGWVSSSDFHSCIEIIGSLIALPAGFACLMYYFSSENRYYLLIGLGFFISGSEDLIHGILSWNRLFVDADVDFSRFIPITYVSGRIVLALLTILATFLENFIARTKNPTKEAWKFSIIAVIIGGGVTTLAFFLPLPNFMFPERIISRPVDFFSALLLFVALILMLKRFIKHKDNFSGILIISLLFNLCGQVYMSFSKQLFDIFFDIAHWSNVFSYVMPILAISIQSLEEMKRGQEVDRMKTDFISSVSHELRTPLASILGFSSTILKDKNIDPKTREEFIGIIHEESTRLSELIEDVLNVSRIEANNLGYNLQSIEIDTTIIDAYETYRIEAEKKEIEMSCRVDNEILPVFADRNAIKQVVINLLGNAIKFTDTGGKIDITLQNNNGSVVLEVADTGIGIPKKDQKKIFGKFYRVYRPGTQIKGTGLGLSIVKGIVDAHKGKIEVVGEIGQGSLFRIYFPGYQEDIK